MHCEIDNTCHQALKTPDTRKAHTDTNRHQHTHIPKARPEESDNNSQYVFAKQLLRYDIPHSFRVYLLYCLLDV